MHTVEIIDDLMCVMDHDANGIDSQVLVRYRDAKRQIQKWTAEYSIDVAAAYRLLGEFFAAGNAR